MQANPDQDMDRQYENLTEKQQAVIDAHANNPEETNREKARVAGEELLGQDGPVNESYCSEILNKKFPDLAEYRAQIEQHGRPGNSDGNKQSVQQAFATETSGVERAREASQPDQSALAGSVRAADPIEVGDAGDGILIKLDYEYVQELLHAQESMLPDELHTKLVDVVVQRAFN